MKYNPKEGKDITDPCGLLTAIPPFVEVILNPVHDRMSRFEMMMKRRFLSKGGRWVISVWNRGKLDKHGRTREGVNPPWTVFFDGKAVVVDRLDNELGIEICILNIG